MSLIYVGLEPNIAFLNTKQNVYDLSIWRYSFYAHVFTSFLLLVTGIIQFIPKLIKKYKKIHKISGYIYILIILGVSAPSAFVMALFANGGLAAKGSFVLLTILWFVFTALSLIKIKKQQYIGHINFMIRSFALSLSALSLRAYAYVMSFITIHASPGEKYTLIAWLSWTINLLIAEWLIQNKFASRLLKETK